MASNNKETNTNGHKPLTFEEILALSKLKTTTIYVERWRNMPVEIKELSVRDYEDLRKQATDRKGNFDSAKFGRLLVAASCVNPSFTYEQVCDLFEGSNAPMNAIVSAINDFNNIGEDAEAKAEESFPGAV